LDAADKGRGPINLIEALSRLAFSGHVGEDRLSRAEITESVNKTMSEKERGQLIDSPVKRGEMGGVEGGVKDAIPIASDDKVVGVRGMGVEGSIKRGKERGAFRGRDRGILFFTTSRQLHCRT
jgi:hypothetical protein